MMDKKPDTVICEENAFLVEGTSPVMETSLLFWGLTKCVFPFVKYYEICNEIWMSTGDI